MLHLHPYTSISGRKTEHIWMKNEAYLDEKRNREILFNVHVVITEMGNYEFVSVNLYIGSTAQYSFLHTGNTFQGIMTII